MLAFRTLSEPHLPGFLLASAVLLVETPWLIGSSAQLAFTLGNLHLANVPHLFVDEDGLNLFHSRYPRATRSTRGVTNLTRASTFL